MAVYIADAFNVPQIASELSDPDNAFFLAWIGGELTGYVKLRRSDRHPDALPECVSAARPMELCRCYVARAWHGRGIADALMTEAFAEAQIQGCDLMWLGVYEENVRAVRFYARWGFRDIGTHIFQFATEAQIDRVMVRDLV
jgi:ribosomal protein S18 acetylase RimI-like enzyme